MNQRDELIPVRYKKLFLESEGEILIRLGPTVIANQAEYEILNNKMEVPEIINISLGKYNGN